MQEEDRKLHLYGRALPEEPVPVTLWPSNMSTELHTWLLEDPFFSRTAEEMDGEDSGFARCVDHPDTPGHVYYEGYFHACGSIRTPLESMHPRWGYKFRKPAAPVRLHAVLEATRRANATWLVPFQQQVKKRAKSSGSRFLTVLSKQLREGQAFADLAVQVHWGDEVGPGYHTDACNSLLHLALSVRGKRALHSLVSTQPKARLRRSDDEIVHELEPPSVYVSSPWAFEHGVKYPTSSFADRTLAIQCRFLFRDDEYLETRTVSEWHEAMVMMSAALKEAPLRMPQLDEVIAVEHQLQQMALQPQDTPSRRCAVA